MLSLVLGHDGIVPLWACAEFVLRPSCLCWVGVIESGDLFVCVVRDCGGGRWVSCLFWRCLMTLRGEAVAAEVVSMGRLHWTLGLGKTRGKIGPTCSTVVGVLLGCVAAAPRLSLVRRAAWAARP